MAKKPPQGLKSARAEKAKTNRKPVIRTQAASRIRKRSVRVGSYFTSLTMEDAFWEGLKEIAQERNLPLNTLVTDIHKLRQHANLSSVIRLFVLDHYRRLAEQKGKR
jgi:predicted DNA-binding ribbon-helix-helix protein